MRYKNLCSLLVILAIPFFTVILHAQSYTIKPIITNKTELSLGEGLTIQAIDPFDLSLNDNDDCIFIGKLSDKTNGIILFANGVAKLVAKSEHPFQISDGDIIKVQYPRINDNGTVVFLGTHILPEQIIKQTIYKFDGDEIIPIASTGDPVQGLRSTIKLFDDINSVGFWPSLNNNEEIAFGARLSNQKTGIFVLSEDVIKPVLVTGDPFPVFEGDGIIVLADLPIINDSGEIAFRATFLKPGGNPTDLDDVSSGVFLFREGDIVPVKLPGEEATGTGGLVFWDEHISWISLGNSSDVVFRGDLIIPGGDSNKLTDRRGLGLFLWSEGNTTPLMLPGDKLLGTRGRLLSMADILAKDSINDSVEIVASIKTTNEIGVFLFSNDEINPVFLLPKEKLKFGKNKFLVDVQLARINNQGNILFIVEDSFGNDTIFLAIKDN